MCLFAHALLVWSYKRANQLYKGPVHLCLSSQYLILIISQLLPWTGYKGVITRGVWVWLLSMTATSTAPIAIILLVIAYSTRHSLWVINTTSRHRNMSQIYLAYCHFRLARFSKYHKNKKIYTFSDTKTIITIITHTY